MDEIKSMVEDISMFQQICLETLTKILDMLSHDQKCYIQAFHICVEWGKVLESNPSKVCKLCLEFDDYIDKIVKELNLPPLVVENQLITHEQLKAKLKDDHL